MHDLFKIAEDEMIDLKQPYVGSHHLFLAYLKNNEIDSIDYTKFKEIILNIIGSCYKESEYVIYTSLLRKIKDNDNLTDKEKVLQVLDDTDSIVYNILLSKGYDIESIYNEIKNAKDN